MMSHSIIFDSKLFQSLIVLEHKLCWCEGVDEFGKLKCLAIG